MADIPTEDQVNVMLDDITHNVTQLREMWRWAAPSIYERPRRRGMEINPHITKRAEDHQMKPRGQAPGSGSEDPIGDIVAATDRYRKLARYAGRDISEAANRVGSAVAHLNDALRLLDDPSPAPEVADVRLLPHPSSARDLARAKAAQARRQRRAQTSGDYGEVTG